MNVHEAHRVRHLMIRLDRGEELPGALIRALDEAEARSGFITGVGSLEAAELTCYDQAHGAYEKTRRIDTPAEVVALSGNVAILDGAASVRLSAVLARETDAGLSTVAGQLIWGRAFSIELHVVAFDDLSLTRTADPRTGLPVLTGRPATASAVPAAPIPAAITLPAPVALTPAPPPPPAPADDGGSAPKPPLRAAPTPPPAPAPTPPPAPAATFTAHQPAATPYQTGAVALESHPLPQRPQKRQDDNEVYPEVGDFVTHFAFGECTVIGSDGDRIRLRQEKDHRVREVALTMLRIEPLPEGEDGSRRFKLHRKN